jgi:AcrR family transcriptional regulator
VSIIPGPKLMKAATKLLAERGAEGTSTRAICEAAGVTQPTLYHHFGDKGGLIEAVVTEGFERALAGKKAKERETDDPVDDLRRGWDDHVSFGVANGDARQARSRTAPQSGRGGGLHAAVPDEENRQDREVAGRAGAGGAGGVGGGLRSDLDALFEAGLRLARGPERYRA